MARISVDLATAFPDKWAALTPGEHTIQIRAKNPGNYLDSDLSTAITFVKVVNYTITANLTNCAGASTNPTTIASNTTGTVLTFTANTGYDLPASVTVTGATSSWNQSTGELTLTKPTGNVTIAIAATAKTYNITVNATNATADPTNPTTITYGTTATLQFTFPTDHTAPDDVTVTGATKQWTKSTGTLVLSNPTANVTVQVAGVWELKELTGTYTWKETIPDATWTEQLVNFALADGTSYKKMYWTDNGTTYNLYYDDMLEGGSETKVYSYDGDAQTGTWVDPKYRIVNFTSEDVQYVPANFYNYVIANTTQATQLATPQNVTADGTVVSWDEVENATSYEVIEGGNNVLGTVKTLFTLSARNNEGLVTLYYKKDGTVTKTNYDGILNYSTQPTNIEGIKSYITFGAFGNGDAMPISGISDMVNCTAEQVSAQVAKLTLTGDASCILIPTD